jgi:BRO family, N-terminal domain
MNTAIVPFVFDGHELRHITLEGIPWFVASDIAGILGLTNPRKAIADHVDREDRDGVTIRDAIGRNQRQSKFLGLELGGAAARSKLTYPNMTSSRLGGPHERRRNGYPRV